jgi:PAS domain S-box-containing protein
MAATERRVRATDKPAWSDAAQALFRAAQVVAHSGGPALFDALVRELADILQAPTVFIAVFGNESHSHMRTLAAVLDGEPLHNLEYPLEGSPCEKVVGRAFRYMARGVAAEFPPGTLFGAKGMDAYAAFPLNDSGGNPLGLLVAMDRRPIADETLAEALLKIFAGRIVAEIERSRADGALRAAALAVSSAHGETVFAELTRYLATILHVELAFIARHEPDAAPDMRMMSVYLDGAWLPEGRYPLESSPCAHVLGQRFRAYPARLQELFPNDCDAQTLALESYAGYPLTDRQGRALGTVGVSSRRPLAQVERIESMLQIFAVRAAAELEQLRAHEALSRSEASYRAIFESAEDAILIHHWDSGELLDVNPKACATYGYSHDALCRRSMADISSGVPPYTAEQARAYLQLAKLDRCPPFEWHRRNQDGSLHWDEVRLKPVVIDGRPHILAFSREITAQKQALEALRASEEQHRSIFNASVDGLLLKNADDEIVDVNEAYLRMHGYQREELIGRPHGGLIPADQRAACEALVPRIVAGEGCHLEARTQRRDGSVFDVELHGVRVQYRGRPLALIVMRDITERKAAEARLRASEEQYRAIFNASADALILWNSRHQRVDVNPAFERVYGRARDDVVGRSYDDPLFPTEYAGPRRELIRRALAGEACSAVLEALRGDGVRIVTEVQVIPITHRGEPHVLAIARDITERLERERALHRSEEQYRGIFNAVADALVLRDADFRIVDANTTYERMSGYTRDQVVGVDRVLANPPEMEAAIRGLHARALAGEPIVLRTQLVRRDGQRYELELRGVRVEHGGHPHVLYIGRDITQAMQAEKALRDSEAQYRAIFNASADALMLWNSQLRRVDVNAAHERIFGFARDDVVGKAFENLPYPEEFVRPRMDMVRRALAGEASRAELPALRKDGRRIVTELRTIPFQHRGEPHVLQIARDVSERLERERQLQRSEALLRQAQKMEAIGQLTGGIAHDFNNILTSVIGYLVLGHERAEMLADATLVRQLGQAQLAAQRARELIAQMLTFARRQRGEHRVLPLAPLVRQTAQLLRATLPSSIVLDVNEVDAGTDDAIPPVQADAVQLEQVLFNLCINARDAMDGAGHIRVGLREAAGSGRRCASCGLPVDGGPWVELSVADSGTGIPVDVQARMFEPFFSTKEVGRGSGMGLAMVHGIVHDHLGHVCVETDPGDGTTFRILLPAAAAASPACGTAAALPAAGSVPGRLAGRVLLVEDEIMVGDFMSELLQGWGLQVVLMRSALAARIWLDEASNALDLLITDQTMPQLTGLALARHASTLRPGLPVLLYTGRADSIEPAELQAHGVRALLRKPVDAEALRTILRRWLDGPHR